MDGAVMLNVRTGKKFSLLRAVLAALALFAVGAPHAEGRDPTAPPGARGARSEGSRSSVAPVVVSAVFVTADGNHAIVNGQVVVAGQSVRDIHIIAVAADGVRYRRGGRDGFAPFGATRLDVKVPVQEKSP